MQKIRFPNFAAAKTFSKKLKRRQKAYNTRDYQVSEGSADGLSDHISLSFLSPSLCCCSNIYYQWSTPRLLHYLPSILCRLQSLREREARLERARASVDGPFRQRNFDFSNRPSTGVFHPESRSPATWNPIPLRFVSARLPRRVGKDKKEKTLRAVDFIHASLR